VEVSYDKAYVYLHKIGFYWWDNFCSSAHMTFSRVCFSECGAKCYVTSELVAENHEEAQSQALFRSQNFLAPPVTLNVWYMYGVLKVDEKTTNCTVLGKIARRIF
jgi:hypothetical protein